MKQNARGFGLVGILIVIVALSGVGFAGYKVYQSTSNKQNNNAKQDTTESSAQPSSNVNPQPIESLTVKDVEVKQEKIYEINLPSSNLPGASTYYSKVTIINEEYLRLSPVYYRNNDVLTLLGNELHGPESAMYVRTKAVNKITQLSAGSSVYDALVDKNDPSVNDAYPSTDIRDYIDTDKHQSLALDDGEDYFAKVNSLTGDFLNGATSVYVLKVQGDRNTPEISLAKAEKNDYAHYTLNDLLFWSNIKSDGQISKAIRDYEQQ